MSDENVNNSPANHEGYERQDLGESGIFSFFIGLAVFITLSGFRSG